MAFMKPSGGWAEALLPAAPRWEGSPRPPLKRTTLEPAAVDAVAEAHLKEYAEIAAVLGIPVPDLEIERFKVFLRDHDLPVFSLPEVVSYMDEKAKKEGQPEAGWEWRPLRAKDNRILRFGRPGRRVDFRLDPRGMVRVDGAPASDLYDGTDERRAYAKTVPLHALKKVALIEKEFTGDVAFFVCDYATLPTVQYPDPFLMAVVPNPAVDRGAGRFVIDFWDEPGFGIAKQIK